LQPLGAFSKSKMYGAPQTS